MQKPLEFSRNLDCHMNTLKNIFEKHSNLLKWNKEPESILEIGIGDGRVAQEIIRTIIPQNIKEYVGSDISDIALTSAKHYVKFDKFKTIQLDIATQNLPVEMHNRFHHIFSSYLFHHVQDIRTALTNIKTMLKPGGQLFFNAFETTPLDHAYDKLDEGKWVKYNNRKSTSPFSKSKNVLKEYENIIESIGFINCHFHKEPVLFRYSEESFKEMVEAVNYRLPLINEEDKDAYREDFLEHVSQSNCVKIIIDEKTQEKIYDSSLNVITGVISKPN